MSQVTESSPAFVQAVSPTAETAETSWPLWIALLGLACLPIGLLWDISHHSTIGRDTFWTPAHIIIQLGGIIPAMLFARVALKTTFRGTQAERDASVCFWGARAPLGVWVTIWGCVAMVSSAPFDDWWHDRYGLDVKIASPPHAVLGLGMFAVGMGVLLFLFSSKNRAASKARYHNGWICAVAVGVMLTLWADFLTEYTFPNLQRSARFYVAAALPFPLLLVLAARASGVRWGATLAAATYMLMFIGMILLLPLFPAQPKLAPVYHPVDHMVPPAFPLLLIAPAAAIDLVMRWLTNRRSAVPPDTTTSGFPPGREWLTAAVVAFVFVAILLAVQWNFSAFLLSDAADNRFFARDGHWPYFVKPGEWMTTYWEREERPVTVRSLAIACGFALLSARIGLVLGNYLLRLRR